MPPFKGGLNHAEDLLYWIGWRKRIESLVAFPSKNRVLRFPILDQEIIGVKFKKHFIFNKAMDRNKILYGIRNMKNVI
jgi:hypothetical protein